ncbi:MAG: NFACT RNA binding domain-containing protein [Candidatus Micrarchaeia archaeon]
MKITLDARISVQENAAVYYEKAKKIKRKIEGLEKAMEETKKEIDSSLKEDLKKQKKIEKTRKEKKWFEKFHWFYTANGNLCIGGKDASQNDLIFKKYMEDNDLFFHADITGGSVVILKNGVNSSREEREEAAGFAASFSRAWKMKYASIDVYSLKKEQLSKYSQGGFVGKGGIAMEGQREWFRNTPLKLKIGLGDLGPEVLPYCSRKIIKNEKILIPGNEKKEKAAKKLSNLFKIHIDEIAQILPSGELKIS